MTEMVEKGIYVLILLLTTIGYSHGQCDNAVTLSYISERLVGNAISDEATPICDYFLDEGWYSMGKYVLADNSDPCQTTYNWYMTGVLPQTPNVETTITACKNTLHNACAETMELLTKLCDNGNYVFYLIPPNGCSEAYCLKDPDNNGGTPAPDMSSVPIPVVEVDIFDAKELVFYCIFNGPSEPYYYDIDWSLSTGLSLANKIKSYKEIKYVSTHAFRSATMLRESHLKSYGIEKLGFSLACSFKAKVDLGGMYSESKVSNKKFCGVEVSNNSWVSIDKNSAEKVQMRLTVPFTFTKDGFIRFVLFIPSVNECKLSQVVLRQNVRNSCGVVFTNDDVKNGIWKPLTISGEIGAQPGEFNRIFALQLYSVPFGHAIFDNYLPDPIHIQLTSDTLSVDGKKCYAHSDPHMFTFDGRKYENQNPGTFILHRNEVQNVETQIKTDKCPNHFTHHIRPWCVCGVAVRAGRDIFKIDNCGTGGKVDPRFERCDDRVLQRKVKRKKGGKEYRVYLPSGTEVLIQMNWQTFLEIDIFPSILDAKVSTGLCGNFDNIKENDPDKNTALTWSVGETTDLFNLHKHQSIKPWKLEKYMCVCNEKNSVENTFPTAKCDTSEMRKCVHDSLTDVKHAMCSLSPVKRSTNYVFHAIDTHKSTETNFRSLYQQRAKEHTVLRRSTYTEETAREDCINAMNTTLFQICSNLPTLNMESFIDNCVSDALITNSMDWTNIHIEGIKTQCLYNIELNQPISDSVLSELNEITKDPNDFNRNNTELNSTTTTTRSPTTSHETPVQKPPFKITPEMLVVVNSLSCLNDCSQHGKCKNGTCDCDQGYMDIDCSLHEDDAPYMLGIPDLGLCDVRQRKCQQTSVFAQNVVESDTLTCKMQAFQIINNGQTKEQATMTNNASLESFTQVTCELPFVRNKRSANEEMNDNVIAHGYRVSISNNRKAYSEEDVIIILDSECINCSKTAESFLCTKKPNYCVNNGNCFNPGDYSGCYICNGDNPNMAVWTPGPECPTQTHQPTEKNNYWIIGATLGPAALILGIVLVVLFYKSKLHPKDGKNIGSVNPIYINS
ncbi:uncharacterized protein LOC132724993 [Ruditapes philippinarum]|uniref:uncharacterized protein LOC132724993 n=1 Tax=Ruditapes philippinarum TaxID=129788 RepID=UPI00295ACAEF|nr:uncharacterized protein LOC132724993 [Ruditapes philippinarum]